MIKIFPETLRGTWIVVVSAWLLAALMPILHNQMVTMIYIVFVAYAAICVFRTTNKLKKRKQ